MRFNVAALPALTAGLLLVIATALGSEPPISNPENGIVANVLHEPEPVMHTYTLPRVTVNLEGDIAPVLFVTNLDHDFPAWEAAPEPTVQAMVVAEPVRTPLPQIASVPQHCPALIVDYFGVNAGAACAVSRCESHWRLDAWNFNPATRDDSHGPFQINFYDTLGPDRLAIVQSLGYPVTTQDEAKALLRSDWNASLRVASVLSAGGVNWSAWSCAPW